MFMKYENVSSYYWQLHLPNLELLKTKSVFNYLNKLFKWFKLFQYSYKQIFIGNLL